MDPHETDTRIEIIPSLGSYESSEESMGPHETGNPIELVPSLDSYESSKGAMDPRETDTRIEIIPPLDSSEPPRGSMDPHETSNRKQRREFAPGGGPIGLPPVPGSLGLALPKDLEPRRTFSRNGFSVSRGP